MPRPLPPGVRKHRRSRLANRLNSAAIHLLRRISIDDGLDGLTPARLSVLSLLVFGGAQSLGTLAARDRVAVPTMSRLVDGMLRDGLVTRVTDAADRRAVRVEVTEPGRSALERARARRIERLSGELQQLDAADLEDLERGAGALERLEQAVRHVPASVAGARRRGKRGRP